MQRVHQFSFGRLMSQNKHIKTSIKIKLKLNLVFQHFRLVGWGTLILLLAVGSFSAQSVKVSKFDMPWYLSWLDYVVLPAVAVPTMSPAQEISGHVNTLSYYVNNQHQVSTKNKYLHLKVDNFVTGWIDHGGLIGELNDARVGFDRHDVKVLPPVAESYLTLVFPHPQWGTNAGDYSSDFHSLSHKAQSWRFKIRAQPMGSKVFLSWEGDPALLRRSRLLEVDTGKVILPNDPRWVAKGYPITLNKAERAYIWQVLASSREND